MTHNKTNRTKVFAGVVILAASIVALYCGFGAPAVITAKIGAGLIVMS